MNKLNMEINSNMKYKKFSIYFSPLNDVLRNVGIRIGPVDDYVGVTMYS